MRITFLDQIVDLFPKYKDYELYARRSKPLLAEDVYILGFSVLNRLEERNLPKILKYVPAQTEDHQEEGFDGDVDLLQTCIKLKTSNVSLLSQVSDLVTRVVSLENEMTKMKCTIARLRHKPTDECDADQSLLESEAEQVVISTPKRNAPREMTEEKNSPTGVNVNQVIPAGSNNNDEENNTSPRVVFRHTKATRQKILKGKGPKLKQQQNIPSPTKASNGSKKIYRVQAAEVCQNQNDTNLLYVGSLERSTSEDSVRAHLVDIGLLNDDILDVMKLKSKNGRQASFCVSVGSKTAVDVIYASDNWPSGVRIRPFNKPIQAGNGKRRTQNYSNNHFHYKNYTKRRAPFYPKSGNYISHGYKFHGRSLESDGYSRNYHDQFDDHPYHDQHGRWDYRY